MRTVTIDIPALRDPFLVSEVLSGATPRIDAIETLWLAWRVIRPIRGGARTVTVSATDDSLRALASACRAEAEALAAARERIKSGGPGEGELVLLTIALGCEAAALGKVA